MGRHHRALWADTIRTIGIVQDNVLHLTVQIRHLHHCAGKFPTLDGGELSLRTIVEENFTQKAEIFPTRARSMFPTLSK